MGETLRQRCTIVPASLSRLFAPLLQFEKREIHTVFLRFPNFELGQKLCLRLLAELRGAALIGKISSQNKKIFQNILLKFFSPPHKNKKVPITSRGCNRGRNRKSPLTEISGLKSYERVVVYRNLSAIAKFGAHFWRKLGVNWRKLWRKHRQFWGNQYSFAPAGM